MRQVPAVGSRLFNQYMYNMLNFIRNFIVYFKCHWQTLFFNNEHIIIVHYYIFHIIIMHMYSVNDKLIAM